MESVTRGLCFLLFGCSRVVETGGEVVELFRPEVPVVAEPVDDRLQAFRAGAVVGVASAAPGGNEADRAQRGEVLGDGWLRDFELVDELRDRVLLAGEQLEYGKAGGVSESAEKSGLRAITHKYRLMDYL
jgi:hypothetical protein